MPQSILDSNAYVSLNWLSWLSHVLFPLQVVEKQRLIEFAEAVHSKLHYFDELENVRFECYLT